MIVDFSKMEWTPDAPENTPGTLDRREMLPLHQDTNGLDQNNDQVQ